MDENKFFKAKRLQDKLMNLATQKKIWKEAFQIDYITLVKRGCFSDSYLKSDGKYLNFDKIKQVVLEEIDNEINEAQREFEEL